MELASTSYWATMAQVMPVFALAVVLEARATAGKWGAATPTFVKAIQSVGWTLALVTLAFGESVALRAMRGEVPKAHWVTLCEWAISWSVGMLVLAPALQLLVKSLANPLARVFTLSPTARLQHWRLERRLKTLDASALEQARDSALLREETEAALRDFVQRKESLESALMTLDARPDDQLGDAEELLRHNITSGIERLSFAINEMRSILARLDERNDESSRIAELREELEQDIRKAREMRGSLDLQRREALMKFLTESD